MADEDNEYRKGFVLLNLADTSLSGLYVVAVVDKTVVQQNEVGGGDKDLVRAKFGVDLQDYNTQRRRKVQTDVQTRGVWLLFALAIESVDDSFNDDFVVAHGVDNMHKLRLVQGGAKLLDGSSFRTLQQPTMKPSRAASVGASSGDTSNRRLLVSTTPTASVEDLGEVNTQSAHAVACVGTAVCLCSVTCMGTDLPLFIDLYRHRSASVQSPGWAQQFAFVH